MNEILTLASEFIERMSNPAYGIRINEDYSLRFGKLLASEKIEGLLRNEAPHLSDRNVLTPHGWLWFLRWTRSKDVVLNGELLLDLIDKWSSVFMQVSAIESATFQADWVRQEDVMPLQKFDHPWLSELMLRCMKLHDADHFKPEDVRTGRAQSILISLLQVGRDITLDAASTLMHYDWPGQPKLVQFFWLQCDGLDNETQEAWISRLRPPKRQFDDELM